jgi:hypothetical protein
MRFGPRALATHLLARLNRICVVWATIARLSAASSVGNRVGLDGASIQQSRRSCEHPAMGTHECVARVNSRVSSTAGARDPRPDDLRSNARAVRFPYLQCRAGHAATHSGDQQPPAAQHATSHFTMQCRNVPCHIAFYHVGLSAPSRSLTWRSTAQFLAPAHRGIAAVMLYSAFHERKVLTTAAAAAPAAPTCSSTNSRSAARS